MIQVVDGSTGCLQLLSCFCAEVGGTWFNGSIAVLHRLRWVDGSRLLYCTDSLVHACTNEVSRVSAHGRLNSWAKNEDWRLHGDGHLHGDDFFRRII